MMTPMIRLLTCFIAAMFSMNAMAQLPVTPLTAPPGAATPETPPGSPAAPVRDMHVAFPQLAPPPGTFVLRGIAPEGQIEFGVRSDEVVTQATLNLQFTPSPSLIPVESQLKVYLNDQLMGVTAISAEQLGKPNQVQLPIDPRYITDFNRLRLVFIGHYQHLCENPANSSLWVDIGKGSSLDLRYQKLPVDNDLSHFPEPFFDARDNQPLTLPMVFAGQPDLGMQQAAAKLASWFGTQAQWRGQHFPVLYNQLPTRHAVVFATNDQRPGFLRDLPPVNGPTVEMISHPDNPYVKLLVVMGRNDQDLVQAVTGIAQGNILFRGQQVAVNKVEQLAPRQPYDAPFWVRTDRPMTFGELKTYPEQLQADGIQPYPIALSLNLPPDLFLIRSSGITMQLKYRYTPPELANTSRLSVTLNNQFVRAFSLQPSTRDSTQLLRLPLLGLSDDGQKLSIPALKLGALNQMRFDFEYASLLSSSRTDRCETFTTVNNHVVIDDSSTIDFSGYRHFMSMPDLRAFINAGFPFSRMADLSETLVLVAPQPQPVQLTALLDALGRIGSQTGYPALGVTLSDDWAKAKQTDADILMIGTLPTDLRGDKSLSLLMDATQSSVTQPRRQSPLPDSNTPAGDAQPTSRTTITAADPVAALVGVQSPYHEQRSIVAILADNTAGQALMNEALQDSGKRAAISGSVAVVRASGVSSLRVGDVYFVGHLPWWEQAWNQLATHPGWLAVMAAVLVVLVALLLWRALRLLSRRRVNSEE